MSRTYRNTGYAYNFFRNPKRNFMTRDIELVRQGAIPPNSYDDFNFSHDNTIIFSMIRRMSQKHMAHTDIAWRITKKFKLTYNQALSIVNQYLN